MKNLILLLALTLILSCCNKDDDQPKPEIEKLPPATQTGANTFGCLLDGQAFIPSGGTNPLDCVYQFANGGYYFALQGNKRNENNNLILIGLSTNHLEIYQNQTYILKENIAGYAYGSYAIAGIFSETNTIQTGELKITKLDSQNQIVAGSFWFDVKDHNGVNHQIRDGRFDMQYTQ
jgi:hypothetical protein